MGARFGWDFRHEHHAPGPELDRTFLLRREDGHLEVLRGFNEMGVDESCLECSSGGLFSILTSRRLAVIGEVNGNL